jgi:hypothetical protein
VVYFNVIPRGSGEQKRDEYTDADEVFFCEMEVTGAKVEKLEDGHFY